MEACNKFLMVVSGRKIGEEISVLKTFMFFSVEFISVDLLEFVVKIGPCRCCVE